MTKKKKERGREGERKKEKGKRTQMPTNRKIAVFSYSDIFLSNKRKDY